MPPPPLRVVSLASIAFFFFSCNLIPGVEVMLPSLLEEDVDFDHADEVAWCPLTDLHQLVVAIILEGFVGLLPAFHVAKGD